MNRFFITFVAASLVAAPGLAGADVRYSTQTSIAQDGALKPMSAVTTFLKDGFERTDSSTAIGAFKSAETTISSRAKKQRITLDPNLKIFVAEDLNASSNTLSATDASVSGPSKAGVGQMIITLGAKFLGLEKMLGRPVRHYQTSVASESSGCCGAGKSAYKSEVWMADVTLPVFDAKVPAFDWRRAFAPARTDCRVDFQRKGDIKGFEAAQKGLALKTITFDASGKPVMVSQITSLSLAPIDAAQFAVPAGFQKMSRADYDAARTQAMMKALGGGQ